MAIDAKVSFLNQTETKLSTEITAADMTKVLSIISDVLEGYEMREGFVCDDGTDDLLECYLDALRVQGRSPKTIDRYRRVIEHMTKELGVHTRRITVYHLRTYLSNMQKKGAMDTTTEGNRQVICAYFNWLQRESLIDRNPAANLGAIKCAKRKKLIFSEVDLDNMQSNCTCIRDRAIISFLASTGCRISEMIELNRDDIDYTGFECVVHGKGNKERTVYLNQVTVMLLRRYFAERNDDNPALFINRLGQRLQPGGVREMMNELGKRAGVEHVHPHKFRRTLATELARHGMPIQEVAKILGHDKLDTTMQYVMLNDADIKHSYMKYA